MKLTYAFLACSIVALTSGANAITLYAATSQGHPGELYTLNPATGAMVTDIGPTSDTVNNALNYPITGLAFRQSTGVLYGSTGNSGSNPATKSKLVTINIATAKVTVVGSFNTSGTMTDIAFSPSGLLFGIGSVGGAHLYSINISTGQGTMVGNSGFGFTTGGGVAISDAGCFGSPDGSHFGTYNTTTGAYTQIGAPTEPVGGGYGALAFSGTTLYGLDVAEVAAGTTALVTIDTSSGAVTNVGTSLNFLDAIAFQPVASVGDWTVY